MKFKEQTNKVAFDVAEKLNTVLEVTNAADEQLFVIRYKNSVLLMQDKWNIGNLESNRFRRTDHAATKTFEKNTFVEDKATSLVYIFGPPEEYEIDLALRDYVNEMFADVEMFDFEVAPAIIPVGTLIILTTTLIIPDMRKVDSFHELSTNSKKKKLTSAWRKSDNFTHLLSQKVRDSTSIFPILFTLWGSPITLPTTSSTVNSPAIFKDKEKLGNYFPPSKIKLSQNSKVALPTVWPQEYCAVLQKDVDGWRVVDCGAQAQMSKQMGLLVNKIAQSTSELIPYATPMFTNFFFGYYGSTSLAAKAKHLSDNEAEIAEIRKELDELVKTQENIKTERLAYQQEITKIREANAKLTTANNKLARKNDYLENNAVKLADNIKQLEEEASTLSCDDDSICKTEEQTDETSIEEFEVIGEDDDSEEYLTDGDEFVAESILEALELASFYDNIIVTPHAIESSESLTDHPKAAVWGQRTLRIIAALDNWVTENSANNAAISFHSFLQSHPEGGISPDWHAIRESDTVMNNNALRKFREFPVPSNLDNTGSILCESHIRIESGGEKPAPRLYYKLVDGRVLILYAGEHLPTSRTK